MLKIPITYTDLFTEEERTETFMFHLTKPEIFEMEAGGLSGFIARVVHTEDQLEILKAFKEFILQCYGERRDDAFVKSDDLRTKFEGHPAYEVLYVRLATEADFAAEFISGVAPKDMRDEIIAEMKRNGSIVEKATPATITTPPPATPFHKPEPV